MVNTQVTLAHGVLESSHGQGILVVAIANIAAKELAVRPAVHDALSVMHIAIPSSTAKRLGVAGILQVDEDEARAAVASAGLSADCNGILLFFVDDHIVGAPDGQVVPPARHILLGVKGDRIFGVKVEQLYQETELVTQRRQINTRNKKGHAHLGHVKHLDPMVLCLAPNDNVVFIATDFTPNDGLGRLGLWETTEVHELALRRNLGESCTVCLGHNDKLPAIPAGPAPGR